jgi:hypothetical protein
VAGHDVVAGELLTVTVMLAVPTLPPVSVARTFMVCVPFVSELVFMLVVQLVVPVAVWGAPLSTLTCTCAMPTLSVAVPETVTVPETVLLLAG